MGKTQRKFNIEFKKGIVEKISIGIASVSEISRRYQIHPVLIYNWIKQYSDGELNKTKTQRERELERENKELKEKIGELVMEIGHLKKLGEYVKQSKKESISIITKENLNQLKRRVT
ncbi:MAG: transposase [Thermodesulfobacteriota bacterium]